MSRKQVSMSVWLPPELVERLRTLSKATRVPQAVIIRDVLPKALAQWEAEREMDRLRRAPGKRWTE